LGRRACRGGRGSRAVLVNQTSLLTGKVFYGADGVHGLTTDPVGKRAVSIGVTFDAASALDVTLG